MYHFDFDQIDIDTFTNLFLYGMIPDISAIIYTNILFILGSLFFTNKSNWLKLVYVVVNSAMVFIMLADIPFYEYTNQRLSISFLNINTEFSSNVLRYIWDHKGLLVIWLFLCYFIYKSFSNPKIKVSFLGRLISIIVVIALSVIGARGGLGLKPITPYNANDYVDGQFVDAWNNSIQTIIYSLEHKELETLEFYTEDRLAELYNPIQIIDSSQFKFRHVVLIVLESFGAEHIGYYHKAKASLTPCLDSIMEQSFVFTNAYANGRTSVQGITALLGGLPHLSADPFISSIYHTNDLNGLGDLLSDHQITSSFYHGAANGSMNFNLFCEAIGIDHYYGMNEYPNSEHYDGNWGIYDEPYLQYCADLIMPNEHRSFSNIFTLSSHDPYQIPATFFPPIEDVKHPIQKSIQYTDHALGQFFKTIKDWKDFDSTAFIITADHASIHLDKAYHNPLGKYKIPMLLYAPSINKDLLNGISLKAVVQQTQIPLSIQYLFGINQVESFAFGGLPIADQSAFRWHKGKIYYTENIGSEEYTLVYNGDQSAFYNTFNDPTLKDDLGLESKLAKKMEDKIKAILQQYNNRMINNRLRPDNEL